jgi:hypothetical protein
MARARTRSFARSGHSALTAIRSVPEERPSISDVAGLTLYQQFIASRVLPSGVMASSELCVNLLLSLKFFGRVRTLKCEELRATAYKIGNRTKMTRERKTLGRLNDNRENTIRERGPAKVKTTSVLRRIVFRHPLHYVKARKRLPPLREISRQCHQCPRSNATRCGGPRSVLSPVSWCTTLLIVERDLRWARRLRVLYGCARSLQGARDRGSTQGDRHRILC